MGPLLFLGALVASAIGALIVGARLRGSPCTGGAIGVSAYVSWTAALTAGEAHPPEFAVAMTAIYWAAPAPIAAFALLAGVRPQRRRLMLSLAGASSLLLVLPAIALAFQWWMPSLIALGLIALLTFFLEAHGPALFGKKPFEP